MLRRRNLECYLLDDEVLAALCAEKGHPELAPDLIAASMPEFAGDWITVWSSVESMSNSVVAVFGSPSLFV